MSTAHPPRPADDYRLENQLAAMDGIVAMSGVHALLRAPLDTVRADRAAGKRAAGVVCGYRGSPLGTVDLTFRAHQATFDADDVRFVNGVNEELAATLLWGTQRVLTDDTRTVDAVVGLWYGKGPGLDRAGDALRHANVSGVPPTGGVVVAVGDDPECKSSTLPSASEWALADLGMPTLYPSSVQEVLDFGRHAYRISRACGSWVGLKIHTDVADGYASVQVGTPLPAVPAFYEPGADGTPWVARNDDRLFAPTSVELDRQVYTTRLAAAHHYVREAELDRTVGPVGARLGVVAAGKVFGDTVTALGALGIDQDQFGDFGIRLYKPALLWPLEPDALAAFAATVEEIVIVEDHRNFLERQVKSLLYGRSEVPVRSIVRHGASPNAVLEPDVESIGETLRAVLSSFVAPERLRPPRRRLPVASSVTLPGRTPYFCSGCPHNRSTEVPEGSIAGGGIGCHGMALFTRNRATGTTQMGGEGVQWAGASMFSAERHRFQNMGDGTLSHSGFLAIRQAVALGTNITFKILANGVVAMTGGQVAAGNIPVPELTRQLEAEGITRIEVIADDPGRYGRRSRFAKGVAVHGRDHLDAVQRELRDTPGVTVLIYDQACAAELRRERKRGSAPTPRERVFINEALCEGCGDCGDVSNCLSVHPVATPFGRKTRIHQDSCNLDRSCLDGDCPALVTVTAPLSSNDEPNRPTATAAPPVELTEPIRPQEAAVLITGIGGTGVVTVAQILSTAALLDGLAASSVDQTGMAQKGGPVVSHLRIGPHDQVRAGALRLEPGRADAYLVFDLLGGAAPANLDRLDPDRTVAIVSTSPVPTGAMVADVDQAFPEEEDLRRRIDAATRSEGNHYLDAEAVARRVFRSQPAANLLIVGVAYQAGLLPVSAESIERAIELNRVAVDTNQAAFRLGRRIALDPSAIPSPVAASPPRLTPAGLSLLRRIDADTDLTEVLAWRIPELIAYQSERYARSYVDVIARVRAAEVAGGRATSAFSQTVARNLFHLMAYKDEYEVARLYRRPDWHEQVANEFGAGARIRYHLQPPAATRLGLKRKVALGHRTGRLIFAVLSKGKRLRGTPLDPFGFTSERRAEQRLAYDYVALVDRLIPHTVDRYEEVVEIASLVDAVRGFSAVKRRNLERYETQLAAALAVVESDTTAVVNAALTLSPGRSKP